MRLHDRVNRLLHISPGSTDRRADRILLDSSEAYQQNVVNRASQSQRKIYRPKRADS